MYSDFSNRQHGLETRGTYTKREIMTTTLQNDIKASVQRQFNQVAANYSTSTVHAQGVDLAEMV